MCVFVSMSSRISDIQLTMGANLVTDVGSLPDNLLMHIFKYLSAKDLCLCERLLARVFFP